jgi:hypothetical protein
MYFWKSMMKEMSSIKVRGHFVYFMLLAGTLSLGDLARELAPHLVVSSPPPLEKSSTTLINLLDHTFLLFEYSD